MGGQSVTSGTSPYGHNHVPDSFVPPLPLGLSPGFAAGCGPPAARNTPELQSCVRLHGPKNGYACALQCARSKKCMAAPCEWGYAPWTPTRMPHQITLERCPLPCGKQSGNDAIAPTVHHLAGSNPHRHRYRHHQWHRAYVPADKHLDLDFVCGRAGRLTHGGGAVAMRPLECRFANNAALFCRESWCGHGSASG